MNKSELIQSLAERIKISNDEASTIVDSFFDSMRDALLRGDRIEIRGFGSFKIKQYEGYVGRNPKTGESVQVKPKKMPFSRPEKDCWTISTARTVDMRGRFDAIARGTP